MVTVFRPYSHTGCNLSDYVVFMVVKMIVHYIVCLITDKGSVIHTNTYPGER